MIIRIPVEALRDPFDSATTLIGLDDAADCDGSVCAEAYLCDGDPVEPGPHHHIVVSGEEPSASRRCFAVFSGR